MKIPQVIVADDLTKSWPQTSHGYEGGWCLARPLPFYSIFARWRCAWLVLTGKADALVWRADQ
jgi:hypothetical protein